MTPNKTTIRIWLPRVGVAIGIALAIAVLLVVPELWRLVPRSTRRPIIEGILTSLVLIYVFAWVGAVGVLVLGAIVLARAKRRECRVAAARFVLASLSTLASLIVAEGAATFLITRTGRRDATPEFVGQDSRFDSSSAHPLRLVVIGESSARGYPYQPRLSVGQIVAWSLQNALPERQVELEILAAGGATLQQMQQALTGLRYPPDILIVYCGHNEFWTRYPATRVVNLDRIDVEALLRVSSVLRILLEGRDRNRVDGPQTAPAERRLIDQPAYTPAEYQQCLSDFQHRLTAIVADCTRQGTLPILIIPPANDAGYEPNRSVLPPSLSDSQRMAFEQRFLAACSAESDPPRAIAQYQTLLEEQPGFAESHYRLGRLLLDHGDRDAANTQFVLARDNDAYAIRCPTPFHNVYREVAASSGALLIDGPAVLRAVNPHGVLDYNLFHDAHHPTFRGHVALAEALLRKLRNEGALGWTSGPVPRVDREKCAQQFSIDGSAWHGACIWSIAALDYGAQQRFDGSNRRAWAREFERAAHAMAQGTAPEDTTVPGLGVDGPWYPPGAAGPRPSVQTERPGSDGV
jgi:hypothetical protein